MSDEDNVTQPGVLDIRDHRIHEIGDGQRQEITGFVAPSGQVYRKHRQLRFDAVDFVDC
jgi:hypothetical protein